MSLSFQEKRALQKAVTEQNKILAGNPSFTSKRQAQKAKAEAMGKLGLFIKPTPEAPLNEQGQAEEIKPVLPVAGANNGGTETATGLSTEESAGIDSEEGFGLKKSGIKAREKINAQVKSITDQVRAGKDPATLTPIELNLLKQYSGKGGLTINSQHEYYTPTHVAEGVWDALKENGFVNGNVLEPSTGAGVFLATKLPGTVITGTEIDDTSATVAQVLNPDDKITNSSFEQLAVTAEDNSFDAVVGNVPFGNARGAAAHDDPAYKNEKLIERYFVQRVIDKVKPGGLICLVVPVNIIQAKGKTWEKFRIAISKKAEFLGGHKLPSKTFGKQGTDTVVDVLVMRKHGADFLSRVDDLAFDTLKTATVVWDEFIEGRYWQGEGKRFIKGEFVPKDPAKFRDSDKVIAGANMTDEALKRSLAIKFDSRIDWELLDSAEPIARNYSEGDTKAINGADYVLKNGEWQKVVYDTQKIALDSSVYGAESVEALQGLLSSDAGILSLGWGHIDAACNAFPNLVPAHVKNALQFSGIQPDAHQWRVFRGTIIGAKIEAYLNSGSDDSGELDELKEIILHEVIKYGHPKDITGLVLAGKESKRLGMFINSIDEAGNFSPLLESGTIKQAVDEFNAKDPLSIITYLFEQNQDPVELSTIISMYEGDKRIEDLGDVAEMPGMAVSPDGFVYPFDQYCSGEVFPKMRAMRDAMLDEKDPRIIAAYKRQIESMDAKRRKTSTEDVTFAMRQKWFEKAYVLEFLHANGYQRTIRYDEESGEWRAVGVSGGIVPQIANYLNEKPIAGGVKAAEYKDGIRALEDQFNAFMQSHSDSEDLTSRYNEVFNGYVEFDYSNSDLGLQNADQKIKTHGYQNEAIRRLSREGKGILGFDVGLGKAQPLDAKILTPSGWVLMGNINVGDLVIAYDGTHVPVTGVFPQGEKEIFEVEFSDGSRTRCCDEHLWFTKTEKDRKNERYHKRNGNNLVSPGSVKSLSEIRETLIYQTQKNHEIPFASAADFECVDFVIDPYLMGVLLGDGCFKSCGVTFTPGDDEIADYAEKIINESGLNVSVKKVNLSDADKASCYSISLGNIGGNVVNPIKAELRKLSLDGLGSHEKFIPDVYLFGSIEQRASLLRGLMDTDGYVSKDGITVQFSSTSKALADGVVHLVQSLSGIAWMSSKIPTYTHNNEKREGRKSYTVSIRMPAETNPFRLQRKADKVLPKTKYKPVRFFTAVRSMGVAPAQCISIDHPSHLYVTDNFIVTHNTFSALALQAYNEQMGRANRTCITVPDSVLANWYHEHKIFYKDTSNMLFIGMSPKLDKNGVIIQERVLDEQGNPKQDKNGADLYQDVLIKDDRETIWDKMHRIPQSTLSLVVMTHPQFGKIPVKQATKQAYADEMTGRELLSQADAKKLMEDKVSYADAVANDRLSQKYADEGTAKQDAYPYFEDMGFDSVIVDEAHCFPAGTLVDGIPIEKLKIGDYVRSFNHETGVIEKKAITDVMSRITKNLVRVNFANGKSIVCTPDHPFFVPGTGYVGAEFLNKCYNVVFNYSKTEINDYNDSVQSMSFGIYPVKGTKEIGEEREKCVLLENMPIYAQEEESSDIQRLCGMREEFRAESCTELEGGHREGGAILLRSGLLDGIQAQAQRGPTELLEERSNLREKKECPEGTQLVADSRGSGEESSKAYCQWKPQRDSYQEQRREWQGHDSATSDASQCVELGGGICGCHKNEGQRLSESLQIGFSESDAENCNRSGRELAQMEEGSGGGCQEDSILVIVGVESVEILEPGSDGQFGGLCPENLVYDITVDGNHNFFAEGVLVHNCFKNSFSPGKESSRIAYLPTPNPSQRAIDMSLKMAHIRKENGGRGPVLLSATPVTNSPLEIYNMLSLLIPVEEFEKFGVFTPDDFIRVFGRVETIEKMKVSGDVGPVDAMVGFQNLDGLRSLFHKYSIIKNAEDVQLPLPDSEEVGATVELSDEQQEIYQALRAEAKDASSPDKDIRASVRPLFSIIRDMDRTTTDLDMYHKQITFVFDMAHKDALERAVTLLPKTVQRKEYDSDLEKDVVVTVPFEYTVTESDSKIIVVMTDAGEDDMLSAMQKAGIPEKEVAHPITPKYAELIKNLSVELEAGGKQIIFIEEKTQHQKLARILVHFLPITMENIGVINATDAAGEKLQRISDEYNSGKKKIIIANKKAEIGVNLQKGTTAIHHLTFPWVPASMQQRNGRGVRQGNTVATVRIYHYIGKGSFDLFRLNLINQKGNWINDILRGNESSVENKGDGHMSTEDIMVLLSDNPEEARARMDEAKAKREAKKKEKTDKALIINLNQLVEARKKLGLLQGWKDEERAKLTDELTKLEARAGAFQDDGTQEAKDKLTGMKYKLAATQRRLETLDAKYKTIEDNTVATVKQKTVFLKAKAASGELPFDAAAIDNPESTLITREGMVIREGMVFEFKTVKYGSDKINALCLVKSVNSRDKTFIIRANNQQRDQTVSINDLHNYDIHQVAMTLEDWDIALMLTKSFDLKGIVELGLDTFNKYRDKIILGYGKAYIVNMDGSYSIAEHRGDTIDANFAWPDGNNEEMKRQIARHYYVDQVQEYKAQDIMFLLFGEQWKAAIQQYVDIATQEDVLSKAAYEFSKLADEKGVSELEYAGQINYGNKQAIFDLILVTINGNNKADIRGWLNGFINDQQAKAKAYEYEKAKAEEQEKIKTDPHFKEIPADLLDKLAQVGITARYNVLPIRTKSLNPAFSLLLFQDKNAKSGLLYAAKDNLKSLFGAQFGSDLGPGFMGAWWYMSAAKDLPAIIATIIPGSDPIGALAAQKSKPEKLTVPYGKVKIGDTVAGFVVTDLGKTWEAKDYHISKVKNDSGFDIEEGDLIQYARF